MASDRGRSSCWNEKGWPVKWKVQRLRPPILFSYIALQTHPSQDNHTPTLKLNPANTKHCSSENGTCTLDTIFIPLFYLFFLSQLFSAESPGVLWPREHVSLIYNTFRYPGFWLHAYMTFDFLLRIGILFEKYCILWIFFLNILYQFDRFTGAASPFQGLITARLGLQLRLPFARREVPIGSKSQRIINNIFPII